MKKYKVLTLALALVCICSLTYIACNGTGTQDQHDQNCTECTKKEFCGIPMDMVLRLIRNYKSEVWQKTSNEATQQYDARFLEISIDELENFICYAKKSAAADRLNVTSVRIYYINYDGEKRRQTGTDTPTHNVLIDYAGCHSLAFVPVVGKSIDDAGRRDYYMTKAESSAEQEEQTKERRYGKGSTVFIPGFNPCKGNVANHNEICPPFIGCIANTLLEKADN